MEGRWERRSGGDVSSIGGPRRIKSESAEGTNRLITCEVDGGANCRLLSNQHLQTGRLAADRCGRCGEGGVGEKSKPKGGRRG